MIRSVPALAVALVLGSSVAFAQQVGQEPEGASIFECDCYGVGVVSATAGWEVRPLSGPPYVASRDTQRLGSFGPFAAWNGAPIFVDVYAATPPRDAESDTARCAAFLLRSRGSDLERWWMVGQAEGAGGGSATYEDPAADARLVATQGPGAVLHLILRSQSSGMSSRSEWATHLLVDLGAGAPRVIAQFACGCGEQGGACVAWDAAFWPARSVECRWSHSEHAATCVEKRAQRLTWTTRSSVHRYRAGVPDSVDLYVLSGPETAIERWATLQQSYLEGWLIREEPPEGAREALPGLGLAQVVTSLELDGRGSTVRVLAAPASGEPFEPVLWGAVSTEGGGVHVATVPLSVFTEQGNLRPPDFDRTAASETVGFEPQGLPLSFQLGAPLPAPAGLHVWPLLIVDGKAKGVLLIGIDTRSDHVLFDAVRLAVDVPEPAQCWGYVYPAAAQLLSSDADPLTLRLEVEPPLFGMLDAEAGVFLPGPAWPRALPSRKLVSLVWDRDSGFVVSSITDGPTAKACRIPRIEGPNRIVFSEYPLRLQ